MLLNKYPNQYTDNIMDGESSYCESVLCYPVDKGFFVASMIVYWVIILPAIIMFWGVVGYSPLYAIMQFTFAYLLSKLISKRCKPRHRTMIFDRNSGTLKIGKYDENKNSFALLEEYTFSEIRAFVVHNSSDNSSLRTHSIKLRLRKDGITEYVSMPLSVNQGKKNAIERVENMWYQVVAFTIGDQVVHESVLSLLHTEEYGYNADLMNIQQCRTIFIA